MSGSSRRQRAVRLGRQPRQHLRSQCDHEISRQQKLDFYRLLTNVYGNETRRDATVDGGDDCMAFRLRLFIRPRYYSYPSRGRDDGDVLDTAAFN